MEVFQDNSPLEISVHLPWKCKIFLSSGFFFKESNPSSVLRGRDSPPPGFHNAECWGGFVFSLRFDPFCVCFGFAGWLVAGLKNRSLEINLRCLDEDTYEFDFIVCFLSVLSLKETRNLKKWVYWNWPWVPESYYSNNWSLLIIMHWSWFLIYHAFAFIIAHYDWLSK